MKHTIIFVVFIIVIVGFLYAISGSKSPQIPLDSSHQAITDAGACLACHGPGQQNARKSGHPPKDECFKCHRMKRDKGKK